jgi:5-formyltetrahydrofolate cyclo-ligase
VNKSQIRNKIIKIRKKKFNKDLKINLGKFISFLKIDKLNFKSIGGYYPSNYEIDDLDILDLLEKKNFKVSLPIIKKDNQMNFYSWSRNDPLKINKFGIPEPVSSKIFYPDILLVPLVAYDVSLNRLGYGGGYYDRYIEKIEKVKKVLKIGLAFSFQKISSIPINQYDKRLDFIVTEKEILK